MTIIEYPRQSFDKMSRKQAITTCLALEAMRDRAVAEVERLRGGREIEQTMLSNALPKLVALERIEKLVRPLGILYAALPDGLYARRCKIILDELRAAIEGTP